MAIKIWVVCSYWADYEGQGISQLLKAFTDQTAAELFALEEQQKEQYQGDNSTHSVVIEEVELE